MGCAVCRKQGGFCTNVADNGVASSCPLAADASQACLQPRVWHNTGTLPSGLKALSRLQTLDFDNNKFTGSLPAAWGEVDAFPNLTSLYLDDNLLSGSVPSSWGNAGAFPSMKSYQGNVSSTGM